MVGRRYSGHYRYGFIGAENDNEIASDGNTQDHLFRSYDPRLGRYKSPDPLARDYPWNSPYAYAENRVIDGFDLEGLEYISVHNFQRLRQENPGMAHAMGVAMTMGGNLQTIHYKGADYFKINTHLIANDGTRLTKMDLYTDCPL
ncbi:MAG: hypothetical protein IPL25_19140 [Saprospiraceae bacterium]|nr:hypothetical protein [Candidatus Vicinibacter affinis]